MGSADFWEENLNSTPINVSAAGDNTLIAAPVQAGSYLAIDFMQIIPSNAVTMQFYSGPSASNKPITGPYPLTGQQVITDENVFQNPNGVFTCAPQTAFVLNLSAGVQCGGIIRYRIVNQN
jgi:hypothetical protein